MNAMWQNAVREAARLAAEKELSGHQTETGNLKSLSYSYRWEHVTAVAALADQLGQLLKADLEVLEAAAWLHDVTKTDGEQHAATGAEFARELLTNSDFPMSKINEVASAIADHIGLWRDEPLTNLHSQILWDADKLSKLGLTFAFHLIGMTVTSERPTSTRELIMTARDANWQEKLIQSLHTAPAKRAARSRLASYRRFWQNLEWELDGSDLMDN